MRSAAPPGPAPQAPRRGRPLRRKLLVAAFGVFCALVVSEILLRALTVTRGDGAYVLGTPLVPLSPPRARSADASGQDGYIGYDADCGWSPRPLGSDGALFQADQYGLRAPAAAPREFEPGAPRILLLGDSFAHSDEVPYEGSLGAALERSLPGTRVLIAGVPAYGTDQAYLRYLALREELRPDVVLIGVHQHDFLRNATLWTTSGWSKPRFVEAEGGLVLVNRPPLVGEPFRRVFDHFDDWELARHHFMYVRGSYDSAATDVSRLLRWIRSLRAETERLSRHIESTKTGCRNEVHSVSTAILREFVRSVREARSVPVVVTLPSGTHLEDLRQGNDWWSATLAAALPGGETRFADLTPALLDEWLSGRTPSDRIYTKNGNGHLTAEGNELVARLVRPLLVSALEESRAPR